MNRPHDISRLPLPGRIALFVQLASSVTFQPEDHPKDDLKKLGRIYLLELAARLGYPKGKFKPRWNSGGWAVRGDYTLTLPAVWICLPFDTDLGLLYRKDVQDRNRWIPWSELGDVEKVVSTLRWFSGSRVIHPSLFD